MKVISKSKLARSLQLNVNSKKVETPCFFPSISTVGLKFPLEDVTKIVADFNPPRILVSCYDIYYYKDNFNFLKKYNNVKFYDSGLYESYWLKNSDWAFNKYLEITKKSEPDIFTSYDYIPKRKIKASKYIHEMTELIDKSNIKKNSLFLPVLHPYDSINILNLTSKILDKYGDEIQGFSLSEKDLGHNIIDIIKNIKTIKKISSKINEDIIIHMLGCGHPINMLIYISLGIDLFDSRSWLNSVLNPYNLMQYPFSYLEGINCECDICKKSDMDYVTKTLLHNIITYESITNSIKEWINNDELLEILPNYIYEDKILSEIKKGE